MEHSHEYSVGYRWAVDTLKAGYDYHATLKVVQNGFAENPSDFDRGALAALEVHAKANGL